jgi:hypothetical protein
MRPNCSTSCSICPLRDSNSRLFVNKTNVLTRLHQTDEKPYWKGSDCGGIRTHEAYATALETVPFDCSGTQPDWETHAKWLDSIFPKDGLNSWGGIRTHEAYATDLKPVSFNHSETQLMPIQLLDFFSLNLPNTGDGDRTRDLSLKRRALLPLSYTGFIHTTTL